MWYDECYRCALLFQFGFDGLFFGRLDYQDKRKREKTKTMELVWRGSDDLGESYGCPVSATKKIRVVVGLIKLIKSLIKSLI